MPPATSVLEVGCGTGRDSEFFSSLGFNVTAIDGSVEAIKRNLGRAGSAVQYHCIKVEDLVEGDRSALRDQKNFSVNSVYMRFFIHSISESSCRRLLEHCFRDFLRPGGRILIECRSVNDPMCGVGMRVGKDEFINGHYRRFIDKDELVTMLQEIGFKVRVCIESDGLSVVGKDDPVLIRVVGQK
jgi:2-polyprenyl-3-methyl-5-hydroxy-6-metoxy-1,4-benzoquinol methylase